MSKTILILIIILTISALVRLYRLDYPKNYIFDEVYYVFTAQEYLKGNSQAWVWWTQAPQGHAYAWVNPPLAQEIMALSMALFHTDELWAARLPGVLLNILSIYLVFLIGQALFKNTKVGLLSAFVFALDGLNFVQSRTAMLDIYLTTFILLSIWFSIKNRLFLSALFLGLALATKWTALYILPLLLFLLFQHKYISKTLIYLVVLPIVYLLVYLPFFLTGHDPNQFIELLRQEWWYHIHLKATHDYASFWWSWPLNLYPVWYFVDYHLNNLISNIFAAGNPIVFWLGTGSLIFTLHNYLKYKSPSLFIILASFFLLWLPWAISSRIMFLYYFAPAVPFLTLSLGYQLDKLLEERQQKLVYGLLVLMAVSFMLIFPFLTGIPLTKNLFDLFFLISMSKNPF